MGEKGRRRGDENGVETDTKKRTDSRIWGVMAAVDRRRGHHQQPWWCPARPARTARDPATITPTTSTISIFISLINTHYINFFSRTFNLYVCHTYTKLIFLNDFHQYIYIRHINQAKLDLKFPHLYLCHTSIKPYVIYDNNFYISVIYS